MIFFCHLQHSRPREQYKIHFAQDEVGETYLKPTVSKELVSPSFKKSETNSQRKKTHQTARNTPFTEKTYQTGRNKSSTESFKKLTTTVLPEADSSVCSFRGPKGRLSTTTKSQSEATTLVPQSLDPTTYIPSTSTAADEVSEHLAVRS
jgi:hypothetical protein